MKNLFLSIFSVLNLSIFFCNPVFADNSPVFYHCEGWGIKLEETPANMTGCLTFNHETMFTLNLVDKGISVDFSTLSFSGGNLLDSIVTGRGLGQNFFKLIIPNKPGSKISTHIYEGKISFIVSPGIIVNDIPVRCTFVSR